MPPLAIRFSKASPSAAEMNSPFSLRNFKAFHSLGLWLAVMMMPAPAPAKVTAISTVGVVDNPRSMTSIPKAMRVLATKSRTMEPEIRASRPMMTLAGLPFCNNQVPKAAVHSTMSWGVKFCPGSPPMVPLMPEIDLISAIGFGLRFDAKLI